MAYLADPLPNGGTAQYIQAAAGALANSGRGNLHVAPINNWDITVAKHFAITERYKVDFMFGLLNAFNHPQFITGSVSQATPISVTNQGQRNFFIPTKGNFNNLRESWPSNARTAQFALKFLF